jgi:hypothetical protein
MTIEQLRFLGYAVVVFSPEELAGADPSQIQEQMVSDGWDVIDSLRPTGQVQEEHHAV